MRLAVLALLLALPACGSDQAQEAESPPPANPLDDRLSGEWRDLFGVLLRPDTIDGAEWDSLYLCPDQADLGQFLRELWPLWLAKRDEVEALPGPWPAEVLGDDIDAPMLAHVARAGCERFTGTVAAAQVLGSAAISEPDLFKNSERWIAFRTAGQSEGFYLVQNPTVD